MEKEKFTGTNGDEKITGTNGDERLQIQIEKENITGTNGDRKQLTDSWIARGKATGLSCGGLCSRWVQLTST